MRSGCATIASVGVACLSACGRVNFDLLVADGSTDPAVDAFVLGPFGPPTLVPELAAVDEDDDPTLTDDLLEIYWESQRTGMDHIYVSTRAAVGAPWSAPTIAMQLDSPNGGACPEISRDGLTIMFSSYRPGPSADIYIASRATRSSAWSTPVAVQELRSTLEDYCPIVTDSGLEVFFHREPTGGGPRDLYRAVRASATSPWQPPILIAELNTAGNDESSFPLPGDLQLVFTSNQAGSNDMYRVTRSAIGQPFGPPTPLDELNTTWEESDFWVSRDGRTVFFSSNRDGDPQIYEVTRL